jgi:hypothetical protein
MAHIKIKGEPKKDVKAASPLIYTHFEARL